LSNNSIVANYGLAVAVLGLAVGGFLGCAQPDSTERAASIETTGEPGSPSSFTTLDGKQLPPPPDKTFGGKIERSSLDSTPYWPPRVVPPKGAPNILLIMTDDAGYGVSSTFGGVIPTPAMDRIADNGLRYTHFHSTSVCSPTRAALITGRNHHQVGAGIIPELSTGYPGYNAIMTKDKATILLVRQESQYPGSTGQQNRAL
jgi:arylsulfatase